jgi:Flp pilus assembly pilin Flp
MRLAGPVFVAVSLLVAAVHLRLEPVRRRSERGASAVEWAVIAGITVAAAVAIGTVIWQKVNTSKDLINQDLPTG